ncbi:endonuclease/exonuclease/phosphatase family protein [Tsuneonella sp. YG55]|uniref:Endonuclease/exonuclease/phosphatase family protein n=1 Tax=Tsuneonella litorea TaxID=2976475 RepID=A0A9X2W2L8_9SPHN|nr:endonuclease/exonuclease/phosphatase family protein [Tsuneonella litorea]MCT2559597.1 endonuclease/exonuclease/phosphatase family protein [Tsuneonella litorea]
MRIRAWIGLALGLVLAGCAHQFAGERSGAEELRAMTYNIRLDLASDGANAWSGRRELVFALLGREQPDVMGLQEVLLHQKADLEAALPGYAFAGVGRDDGAEGGEFSPVAWRRARFEALETGTFWLSPAPAVPGKGWDAAFPRIASWALLRDRSTGMTFRILNTHLDHVGTEARARSGAMLAEWAARHVAAGERVIVLGDFNSTPDMPAILTLADPARGALRNTRAISATPPYGPAGTFNAFRIDRDDPAPIDHIFVSGGFAVLRHATITQHWGGRLPSDHYPVIADLKVLD